MTCYVQLPNFPEWAIPMMRVIPKAYTEDGYNSPAVIWKVQCRHLWQLSQGQIVLKIDLDASATLDGIAIPVYIDIDLVFFNERTGNQINTNKT
jgi:hypothetical protein